MTRLLVIPTHSMFPQSDDGIRRLQKSADTIDTLQYFSATSFSSQRCFAVNPKESKQTLPHPSSGVFRLNKFRSVNLTLHPDSSFRDLVWLLWSHWCLKSLSLPLCVCFPLPSFSRSIVKVTSAPYAEGSGLESVLYAGNFGLCSIYLLLAIAVALH